MRWPGSAAGPRPWLTGARAIGLVLFVVVGVGLYMAVRAKRDLTDFAVYRTAAVRAVAAEPLYRPEDGHYQFKYLPAFALGVAPLAVVSPSVGKALWFGLSFVLLAYVLRRSVTLLPDRRQPTVTLVGLVTLVLARYAIRELTLGQSNLLMAALLVGALATAAHRPAVAGALVAISVFVKPYAVVFLPWLGVVAGVSALGVAAVVLAAGLLLPALVYGWTGNVALVRDWVRTVTDTTAPNLLHPDNISLASAWAKWLGAGAPASAAAALSAVLLLGLIGAVWWERWRVPHPGYLEFGLLLVAVPLLSPQGWDYVLLIAAPAVACAVDRWPTFRAGERAGLTVSLLLIAVPWREIVGLGVYTRVMGWAVVTAAALVLICLLAVLRRRAAA